MQALFLDAPYAGNVELCPEILQYLKKKQYTTVALYASVQFVNQLERVREQLVDVGITVVTSKADRTHVSSQLLGCDNYHDSLNLDKNKDSALDAYLYVGDGKFHPLALVYAQKDQETMKEIVCNDPIQKAMSVMSVADIKTILLKYRGSLI
ncbi:MAG: diphthamide synthesis protein, partial [Nanoarchaeota archaeon]